MAIVSTGRFHTVKMSCLPKLIYRFNVIPIKPSVRLSCFVFYIDELFQKFTWIGKGTRIAKTILKNKVGEPITPPNKPALQLR